MSSLRIRTVSNLSVALAILAAPVPRVTAQVDGFIDAGSGTIHLGSEAPFGVVRLAPLLRLSTPAFLLSGGGEFAGHTEHGWQSNGHLRAAARRTFGRLEVRLGLDGGMSRTRWGRSASGWLGEARLQLANDHRGLAIGAGSGHSFTSGGSQPLSRIEAGGWSRVGRIDFGFWLKRTGLSVPEEQSTDVDPRDTLTIGEGSGRRTLQDHYTDVEATLGWSRGNLTLEAGAGRRFGRTVRVASWHVRALYQVTTRVALVASSGQFPVDVVSGLPSGGFTTFSMRFNLRRDPSALTARDLFKARRGQSGFTATATADGTHLIAVRVPQASVVEMMGDFTDWNPVLLVPGDQDTWRLRLRIPAGMHEVNLRVDGGPWLVPAGLTRMDDGLGGAVGVFVID